MPSLPWDGLNQVPVWALGAAYVGVWTVIAVFVGRLLRRSLDRIARHRRDALSEVLARSLPRPATIAVMLVAFTSGLRLLPLGPMHLTEAHRLLSFGLAVL